jgi:hypothetical protein
MRSALDMCLELLLLCVCVRARTAFFDACNAAGGLWCKTAICVLIRIHASSCYICVLILLCIFLQTSHPAYFYAGKPRGLWCKTRGDCGQGEFAPGGGVTGRVNIHLCVCVCVCVCVCIGANLEETASRACSRVCAR